MVNGIPRHFEHFLVRVVGLASLVLNDVDEQLDGVGGIIASEQLAVVPLEVVVAQLTHFRFLRIKKRQLV